MAVLFIWGRPPPDDSMELRSSEQKPKTGLSEEGRVPTIAFEKTASIAAVKSVNGAMKLVELPVCKTKIGGGILG